MNTVRWGILGCGDVTEIKSGPGFQKATGSQLLAVMRRRGDLAKDYAARHQVPRWYDDADALINDAAVDAVYVAAPPGAHLDLALKVAAVGKPAYVEKPMARNYTECRRMIDAFQSANLPLFVAYYRRGLPRFVKAKEILDSDRLGKITSVTYRQSLRVMELQGKPIPWRVQAVHSGGGLFLDLGSHTLDILDFLLGSLQDVSGSGANIASPYAVEDSVSMKFRTSTGAVGAACWNFASAASEDIIEITGTKARLSMSTFGNDPVVIQSIDGTDERFDLPNPPHVHQPLIQTIVNDLLGDGKCPSTGESAARTSRVMDAVLSDYYHGRDDSFWERESTWAHPQTGLAQPR